ncbi:hypothetical protein KI387_026829, partial [Taxus chinensis]
QSASTQKNYMQEQRALHPQQMNFSRQWKAGNGGKYSDEILHFSNFGCWWQ